MFHGMRSHSPEVCLPLSSIAIDDILFVLPIMFTATKARFRENRTIRLIVKLFLSISIGIKFLGNMAYEAYGARMSTIRKLKAIPFNGAERKEL
jgi:hypothetical protein